MVNGIIVFLLIVLRALKVYEHKCLCCSWDEDPRIFRSSLLILMKIEITTDLIIFVFFMSNLS